MTTKLNFSLSTGWNIIPISFSVCRREVLTTLPLKNFFLDIRKWILMFRINYWSLSASCTLSRSSDVALTIDRKNIPHKMVKERDSVISHVLWHLCTQEKLFMLSCKVFVLHKNCFIIVRNFNRILNTIVRYKICYHTWCVC